MMMSPVMLNIGGATPVTLMIPDSSGLMPLSLPEMDFFEHGSPPREPPLDAIRRFEAAMTDYRESSDDVFPAEQRQTRNFPVGLLRKLVVDEPQKEVREMNMSLSPSVRTAVPIREAIVERPQPPASAASLDPSPTIDFNTNFKSITRTGDNGNICTTGNIENIPPPPRNLTREIPNRETIRLPVDDQSAEQPQRQTNFSAPIRSQRVEIPLQEKAIEMDMGPSPSVRAAVPSREAIVERPLPPAPAASLNPSPTIDSNTNFESITRVGDNGNIDTTENTENIPSPPRNLVREIPNRETTQLPVDYKSAEQPQRQTNFSEPIQSKRVEIPVQEELVKMDMGPSPSVREAVSSCGAIVEGLPPSAPAVNPDTSPTIDFNTNFESVAVIDTTGGTDKISNIGTTGNTDSTGNIPSATRNLTAELPTGQNTKLPENQFTEQSSIQPSVAAAFSNRTTPFSSSNSSSSSRKAVNDARESENGTGNIGNIHQLLGNPTIQVPSNLTTELPTHFTPPLPVHVVEAVVEAVAAEISVTPSLVKGDEEVHIILKPNILDGSEITLSVKDGALTCTITPANNQVGEAIAAAIPRLETALAEHVSVFHNFNVELKKGKSNETV